MCKTALYALALLAAAACTSNDYVGDETLREANSQAPISFGMNVPAITRADKTGSDAATDLGKQFIVYAEKNETTDGKAPAAGNLVFQNYQVNWVDNSAYTTTSNTKGWEYVGYSHTSGYQSSITTSTTDAQTIKYWDYNATNYVFTAVSAKGDDITAGRVKITKTTAKEDGNKIYDKGYTITLAKDASNVYPSLANLYFADRNEIAKGTGTDRTATNAYGGNVTMKFRNLLAHVRAGVYETIPGYDIISMKFYITGDAEAKVESTSAFGAIVPNTKTTNYEGTLTVTYYNDGDVKNQPKVAITGTPATDLILGTNFSDLSTTKKLGTTSADPTYDTSTGGYTDVLPQIDNTTNLKLKADYTLYNSVTGETIEIKGATAEVPGQYLAWKPNYKYTYLFKITDHNLYPITFDAVVVEDEDGAEYITTVSEPSITTFGVKDNKYSAGKNEYEAGSDIYATIMDGSSVVEPTLGTNVNVYLATTTDATKYSITEASVAESIAETSGGTKKITIKNINTDTEKTYFTDNPSKVTKVPGEDGVDITINALKLTGVKATTGTTALVVEYIKTPATYSTTGSTYADESAFSAAGTLYTDADGTTVATWGDSSTTYYKRTGVKTVGSYAYKVINVAAAVAP